MLIYPWKGLFSIISENEHLRNLSFFCNADYLMVGEVGFSLFVNRYGLLTKKVTDETVSNFSLMFYTFILFLHKVRSLYPS